MEALFKNRNEYIAFERGYSVSPNGLVVNKSGQLVKVSINSEGYMIFGIGSTVKNTFKNISVHRLQAFMKFGVLMYKYDVVRHLDGDRLNNSIDNISVGSYIDNYNDISKKDRKEIIKKMAITKRALSKTDINSIFKLKKDGMLQCEIAKQYGLSAGHISNILNGKTTYLKF